MKPLHIFLPLCLAFLGFSIGLYQTPASAAPPSVFDQKKAAGGRLVWQRYNCQGCHQLYGLGGYLGPDLTNVYGSPGKGEPLIRALLPAGNALMPDFDLPEDEMQQLLEFLKAVDQSGSADPRNFTVLPNGMTERK